MTDKEFKRLSRAQLIEIIYQLQTKQEELTEENQKLQEELTDRRLRVRRAGNIAEAALEVNGVMQAAQKAAEQYLEEIRAMRAETEEVCMRLRQRAQEEAAAIVEKARKTHRDYDTAVETILNEYQKK